MESKDPKPSEELMEDIKVRRGISVEAIDAEAIKVRSLSINENETIEQMEDKCEEATLTLKDAPSTTMLDMEAQTIKPSTNEEGSTMGEVELEPQPSCSKADESEPMRRSNSFHRRNYRKSNHGGLDEESNDGLGIVQGDTTAKSRARINDSKRHSEEDTSEEKDLPRSKYMKQDGESSERRESDAVLEENNSSATSTNTSSAGGLSDLHDFSDEGTSDHAINAAGDESPDHSVDLGEHDTSSSSSHGIVFEDEGSSSTSSSDNFLEDLEERSSEQTRAEEVNVAAQPSSSSQTTKPKTDSKKKAAELPNVLRKAKPKHKWIAPREILRREMGLSARAQPQAAEIFRAGFYGSLFSAERLELMCKLDGHKGCVNCLNFNYAGTKLASGSDDLEIKIWNYSLGKCISSFQSGHRANVFQAKFVPYIGLDTMIVSCARDNQVRLNELSSSGEVRASRKLAQHRGPAHKLSVSPENPHIVLSCGEDSVVFSIDIREDKPNRLVSVRENAKKVSLYSIHQNPISPHEFCVSGKDQFVRIYDTRKLRSSSTAVAGTSQQTDEESNNNVPLKKFCPHLLTGSRDSFGKTHVTCAMYNYNGRELVCSYNDENIYLFDTSHSDGADYLKSYEGHRNSATVKGVNFFGDRSQFIVSGSDCGHVFLWDKETESIVNFFRGDESGVVNCLEGHPSAPILATSGLDDDIKIWVPSHEKAPQMMDLAATVRKNIRRREEDWKSQPESDNYIMWALINQMRSVRPGRHRVSQVPNDSDSGSDDSWEDDDDDEDGDGVPPRGLECVIS